MYLLSGEARPARKADNLTAICEPIVYKMWDPRCLTTLEASTALYKYSFTYFYTRWHDRARNCSLQCDKPWRGGFHWTRISLKYTCDRNWEFTQHVSAPTGHPQVKYNYTTYIFWKSHRYYNGSVVLQMLFKICKWWSCISHEDGP
jgi:hypothetical protein